MLNLTDDRRLVLIAEALPPQGAVPGGAEVTGALPVPSDSVVGLLGLPLLGGRQRGGPEHLARAGGPCTGHSLFF